MTVTHTYQTEDAAERQIRQAAIYRRCLLLLSKLQQGGRK